MPPRLEQALLGQRARRHQPHHLAPHHRLRAALARLRRVLHLLADRDAEPLADQRQQVAVGRVHRHAAHRDVLRRDAGRAWSARCRARRSPPRHRRRTSRRSRPSGRTAAHRDAAALISRYCAIIGETDGLSYTQGRLRAVVRSTRSRPGCQGAASVLGDIGVHRRARSCYPAASHQPVAACGRFPQVRAGRRHIGGSGACVHPRFQLRNGPGIARTIRIGGAEVDLGNGLVRASDGTETELRRHPLRGAAPARRPPPAAARSSATRRSTPRSGAISPSPRTAWCSASATSAGRSATSAGRSATRATCCTPSRARATGSRPSCELSIGCPLDPERGS